MNNNYNIEPVMMDSSELIGVLQKQIIDLQQKNKKLFCKKKNLQRSNLRLKKMLSNSNRCLETLRFDTIYSDKSKNNIFKPILKPISESDDEINKTVEMNEINEWDYIEEKEMC